jgi:hypothetical protein
MTLPMNNRTSRMGIKKAQAIAWAEVISMGFEPMTP